MEKDNKKNNKSLNDIKDMDKSFGNYINDLSNDVYGTEYQSGTKTAKIDNVIAGFMKDTEENCGGNIMTSLINSKSNMGFSPIFSIQ